METFVPRLFAQDEPRLSNIMKCIIYYESQVIEKKINKDIRIIGNSGILQDLALQPEMKYKIFSYDGQIFIAPADYRVYEPRKIIYSGKKFVQIMTNKTGPCDGSHYKTLQEVDLGNDEFKVLAASEIDCYLNKKEVYDLGNIEVKDHTMKTEDEQKPLIFIEIRSMLCRRFKPEFFKLSAYFFLRKLHSLRNDFWASMIKMVIKCVVYNQKILVLGIRDDGFNQLGMKLISLPTLVDFLKESSKNYYKVYTSAIDKINLRLKEIVERVEDGQVYQLDMTPTSYDLYPLPRRLWEQEMNKLVTKEFRDWREKGIVSEDIKKGKSYDRQLDALVKEGEDYYLMKMVRHLERLGLHDRIDTEDTES
ncbi:unnamed protein product [[Candida] boidinii]|uniref:Unnamed protein product n=1 Tax=Candida boidinii TaxID=5477 RepID=A0ACB5TVB6_CANBO|nr:unnamed protein product [[Candida] boidinii]